MAKGILKDPKGVHMAMKDRSDSSHNERIHTRKEKAGK